MWLSKIPIPTSGHPVNARDRHHPRSQVLNPHLPFSIGKPQTPARSSAELLRQSYALTDGASSTSLENADLEMNPPAFPWMPPILVVRLLRRMVYSSRANETSLMTTTEADSRKYMEDNEQDLLDHVLWLFWVRINKSPVRGIMHPPIVFY